MNETEAYEKQLKLFFNNEKENEPSGFIRYYDYFGEHLLIPGNTSFYNSIDELVDECISKNKTVKQLYPQYYREIKEGPGETILF